MIQGVHPNPLLTGNLNNYLFIYQCFNQRFRRWSAHIQSLLKVCRLYNRFTIQQVQGEACRASALAHCQHRLLYFGMEGQNLPEDLSSFGCGLSHFIQKKTHPMGQVITDSYLRQGIIIAGAVTFKKIR